MRRARFRFAVILLTLLPLCVPAAAGFYLRPHLQNITPEGITIIWETDEACVGAVEYGLETALDKQAAESQPTQIHKVRLTGLQPESTYAYRVRAGNDTFSSSFKTAPSTDRPIRFVVVGDSRRWEKRWEETAMAAHALQWNPEFFLNMGDLVNSGHRYEQWPEHFSRFSDFNHRLMMITARGNHEGSRLRDVENDWFAKYHEFPGEGEPFASFEWGNTHLVVLSGDVPVQEAASWLDAHLAGVKKRHVIVTQHYPIYCTGYRTPTDSRKEVGKTYAALAEVLEKHSVPLFLTGHTHIYERTYPIRRGQRDDRQGVTHLIQGGDINSNFPDWWTAVGDDPSTMAKPTYTLVECKEDRIELRSFCWSTAENRIIQIDRHIIWRDESVPAATFASLRDRAGQELLNAIEELGAMAYAPAVPTLAAYLGNPDAAVRRAAASALRAIGTPEASEALAPHLDNADVIVRREAARAVEIAMPSTAITTIVHHATNPGQDAAVRSALIGALHLRAPQRTAYETALAVLESDAPPLVRQRAAYAIGVLATKPNVRKLTKVFNTEQDRYVLMRLAHTLNNLTGHAQSLDDKGPLAISKPGQRRQFIQEWLKGD